MNPRAKGKEETAYNIFCNEIEKAFIDAVGAGVALDDLLYYAHGFVIRRMDPRLLAMATRESAFELRLKKAPHNEGQPVQDALREGRTPFQENSGKNPCRPGGLGQAPNNSQEGNHPCPESCRLPAAAAILEALFAISDPAREECAATGRLPGYARQTAAPFCNRSDTRGLHQAVKRQESCREYPQTSQPSQKYMSCQFPCPALRVILALMGDEKQCTGGAA